MGTIAPLDISRYTNIVLLTGAGISVASGIRPFRGPDGIYTKDVEWISDGSNLPDSLPAVWQFYGGMRGTFLAAQPNTAHLAIARFQERYRDTHWITLITQNVDGLHQRAGSLDTIELHGGLLRSRCTRPQCSLVPFDDDTIPENPPPCPACGAPLRPDIVLFNEALPIEAQWKAKRALRDCHLFIAVGTSGTVSPAADFVRGAAYVGARTILVNLEPMEPRNPVFQEEYLGKAEELLPILLGNRT